MSERNPERNITRKSDLTVEEKGTFMLNGKSKESLHKERGRGHPSLLREKDEKKRGN